MAKPRPEDFPPVRGDAQMLPYFNLLPRVPIRENMRNSQLPTTPAIYFVYAEPDIIVYVGKSTNLWQRWTTGHLIFRISLSELSKTFLVWLPCEASVLATIEKHIIKKLRPVSNRDFCSGSDVGFLTAISKRRSHYGSVSN